jgi:hypothetical protein
MLQEWEEFKETVRDDFEKEAHDDDLIDQYLSEFVEWLEEKVSGRLSTASTTSPST